MPSTARCPLLPGGKSSLTFSGKGSPEEAEQALASHSLPCPSCRAPALTHRGPGGSFPYEGSHAKGNLHEISAPASLLVGSGRFTFGTQPRTLRAGVCSLCFPGLAGWWGALSCPRRSHRASSRQASPTSLTCAGVEDLPACVVP